MGGGQVWPQMDKTVAIASCPRPKTKKEVRLFLGLVGDYHRFVPGFADLTSPLTDLTQKGGCFVPAGKGGKLSEREARLSTIEKECLAIQWVVNFLCYYLLGRPFTLCSDHTPLHFMHPRMKDANTWFGIKFIQNRCIV